MKDPWDPFFCLGNVMPSQGLQKGATRMPLLHWDFFAIQRIS